MAEAAQASFWATIVGVAAAFSDGREEIDLFGSMVEGLVWVNKRRSTIK